MAAIPEAEPIDSHLTLGLYTFSTTGRSNSRVETHNREVLMITSSRVPRPLPRWVFMGLVLVSLTFTPYRAAAAQDTTTTLTDEGLRQLAEVVDGVRTGGLVWVVMCGTQAPYEVLGTYSSVEAALAAVRAHRAPATCGVYGPYAATSDRPGGVITYGEICRKRDDSSCAPSDTLRSQAMVFAITDVARVRISYQLRDGRTVTSEPFRPQDGEAIFFTMTAVDKLLIPYLHRVYGVDYAQRERARLLQASALRR